MTRPIYEIAREIEKVWRKKDGSSAVWFGAVPYLRAMKSLTSIDEMYGADTGKSCVLYFLSNATTWRGEDARRIKTELKKMAGVK